MNLSDKFKGLNLDQVRINMSGVENMSRAMQLNTQEIDRHVARMNREMREKEDKEERFKESMLSTLRGIEKNTGNLSEIAFLLKEGNVARDEIYLMFEKMFSILNAKSKEDADEIYRKVMQEASDFNTGVDVINKLSNFGLMIYKMMFPDS